MNNVIKLASERAERKEALEAAQADAFELYRVLAVKAQKTLRMEDALAAGRAWGNFIGLFGKL